MVENTLVSVQIAITNENIHELTKEAKKSPYSISTLNVSIEVLYP
jgi:hypothetical protein